MKKILFSLLTIGVVGAGAYFGVTRAFFSDTETSTGNTFVAGDIDLKIDNTSYAFDYNFPDIEDPTGAFVASTNTSWTLRDLTVEKFFDFYDLKPGDYGEDTISIHVGSNDAWLCAATRITEDLDNSYTEPEDEVAGANNDSNDGTADGDLDSGLNFAFWVDDGDNVYEPVAGNLGVAETLFLQGPMSAVGNQAEFALADSFSSVLGSNVPVPGDTTFYIGKIWCYGALTPGNLVQDGTNTGSPLGTQGTGFTCDGSDVSNIGQTDSVVGDLQFYAVQARHNTEFSCEEDFTPAWPV